MVPRYPHLLCGGFFWPCHTPLSRNDADRQRVEAASFSAMLGWRPKLETRVIELKRVEQSEYRVRTIRSLLLRVSLRRQKERACVPEIARRKAAASAESYNFRPFAAGSLFSQTMIASQLNRSWPCLKSLDDLI